MSGSYEHIDQLKYDISVFVRYHERRRAFFDFIMRLVYGITVFGGSAAAVAFISSLQTTVTTVVFSWIGLTGSLIIAALNAYALVVGVSARAREHEALYRRYVELLRQIEEDDKASEHLSKWVSDFLRITTDEPTMFKAVFILSQNEANEVWRSGQRIKIGWLRAWFANWRPMSRLKLEEQYIESKRETAA